MSKKITVGKSYLALLILGRPKQRERNNKIQKSCSQKSPVKISANRFCEFFEGNIKQFETAIF